MQVSSPHRHKDVFGSVQIASRSGISGCMVATYLPLS